MKPNVYFNTGLLRFVFQISGGAFILRGGENCDVVLARGYSGAPGYVNEPFFVDRKGLGPIPVGLWHIEAPRTHARFGPVCFFLQAEKGTEIYGRSGFYIHGDNARGDGSASTGCIVLDRRTRDLIAAFWTAGVRRLHVHNGVQG